MPFLHAHKQNEELYIVLSGQGEMQADGEIVSLREGSAVRIAPSAWRCWRATGTEPMVYLVIQAKAGSLEQATGSDGLLTDQPVVWS
jgi:mannose-6-phosphate isomerase-like protein (cupin superfamily)